MKCIAVIITGVVFSHMRRIADGIRKCAHEENVNLVFLTCERRFIETIKHDVGEYKIFEMFDYSYFDGVIVVNSTIYSKEILKEIYVCLRAADVPVASLDYYLPDAIYIHINNKNTQKEMTRHLIQEHGCRRLKIVTGPLNNIESRERLSGFITALNEAGIPFEEDQIFEGNFLKSSGESAVRAFLDDKDGLPDGIVFSNDQMAVGGMDELRKRGIRIPEDVRITGFDDDDEAKLYYPRISSVRRCQEEEGYLACKSLLHNISEEVRKSGIEITTTPVFRESCGCTSSEIIDEIEFRKKYFAELNMNESLLSMTKSTAIDLTTVDSFAQLRQVILQSLKEIECKEFYMMITDRCMKPLLHSDDNDLINADLLYDDTLRPDESFSMLVGYRDGEVFPSVSMTFEKLMGELKGHESEERCYVVLPVHFTDRIFGYCIFGESEFAFTSPQVYSWVMNIGNAIETIRRRQGMQIIIDRLNNLWGYDTLTDLFNRAGFIRKVARIWEQHEAMKQPLTLFFADIDNLKTINDESGHDEGDICILAFANILKAHKQHGEIVMRYGGDEFVVLVEKASDVSAWQYVTGVQRSIENYNLRKEANFILSASIGYSIVQPSISFSLQDAIELADQRMYESKKAKKRASQAD